MCLKALEKCSSSQDTEPDYCVGYFIIVCILCCRKKTFGKHESLTKLANRK